MLVAAPLGSQSAWQGSSPSKSPTAVEQNLISLSTGFRVLSVCMQTGAPRPAFRRHFRHTDPVVLNALHLVWDKHSYNFQKSTHVASAQRIVKVPRLTRGIPLFTVSEPQAPAHNCPDSIHVINLPQRLHTGASEDHSPRPPPPIPPVHHQNNASL